MFKIENWKDIVGFEGQYQVSDQGRIKSLYRTGFKSNGHRFVVKEIIRKPVPNTKNGYLEVIFPQTRKAYFIFKIHRLVAQAFIGASELHVNHKNGDVTDNRAENLEYVTNLENMNHRYRDLRNEKNYGVYWHKKNKKWISQIKVDQHRVYLGCFEDKEEAYDVYYLAYLVSYGYTPW
jgi:hypothetical protein